MLPVKIFRLVRVLAIFFIIVFGVATVEAQVRSVYTDLDANKCRTLELNEDEGGSYKGECSGVAGFKLHVIEGDLRQTVDVVSPGKKVHELKFWEFFGGFSSVGPRAEWRMRGKTPVALIVRFNVSEDPEDSTKITSHLLVAKITPSSICVTNMIKPSRTQNAEARRAADSSSRKPCKQP